MYKGNISNVVQPRIALVFEGALGHVEGDSVDKFNVRATAGDWRSAWQCWDIDKMMKRKMWDVVTRQGIRVSIVSYIGDGTDGCRQGLQDFLDDFNVPAIAELYEDAEELARGIAFMPDLLMIYDANPETAMMYGSRGKLVMSYKDLGA